MRWLVGLLLVCAAVLKAIELIVEPALAMATPIGRYLVPLQIATELSVGAIAMSGLYWRRLRWFALLLFTGFALYSLYLALSGASSCGCFGFIKVHPWWTGALDLAVVTGLLLTIFAGSDEAMPMVIPRSKLAAVLVALSVGVAIVVASNSAPRGAESIAKIGALVVLEPEEWIGKPLPIADFINADLSKGDWIVLLHRHDCPDCQEAAPQYEDLADAQNVAIVEMPPYGSERLAEGPALHARMPDDRDWFVQTPVEIRVKDGVVLHASTELPAIVQTTEL